MVLERIHQVLGNLVQTYNIKEIYVDGDALWPGIFVVSVFMILYAVNRLICYIRGIFLFGRNLILPIKHMAYWELIRQQRQRQINKDNIRKNGKIVDHDKNWR